MKKTFIHECVFDFHCSLYHVLLSLKRGTVSARNITLLIDKCVNFYCGLLFNNEGSWVA